MLTVAALAVGLDVGVARFTYGVALPAFARDLQLSLTAAGLLGTAHLVGYLLGTLASPTLNARLGAHRLYRASQLVFAAAMLACGLTVDVTTMAVARVVTGLAAGSGVFAIFLIVFDATAPARRPAAGALVWAGIGVAIIASGLASAPIVEGGAWRLSFIVPAGLSLALALLMPRTQPAARASSPAAIAAPSRRAELASVRWSFLFVAYFLFGAGYISYATFAGVLLKSLGLSMREITGFWVMYGAASMIGAALGATLLSAGATRRIALSAALGCGALGAALGVHGASWSVFAASTLVGLGLVATPATITFLIRSRASDATYPFFFTVGTAMLGLGQLVSPAIGGLLADWLGPPVIGWFAAALYGAGMLAAAADGFVSRPRPVS
ncbi:MAG: YbfB/YjiJ family MFS transporter [Alphaproteobacteria bacterium]|nr:YbfB/YjiJ family MFS transporter [Alphaproteobacteria bacterium]